MPVKYQITKSLFQSSNSFIYTIFQEKAMAPHSSTLTWKIPWVDKPVGLQSMGSLRVRHN